MSTVTFWRKLLTFGKKYVFCFIFRLLLNVSRVGLSKAPSMCPEEHFGDFCWLFLYFKFWLQAESFWTLVHKTWPLTQNSIEIVERIFCGKLIVFWNYCSSSNFVLPCEKIFWYSGRKISPGLLKLYSLLPVELFEERNFFRNNPIWFNSSRQNMSTIFSNFLHKKIGALAKKTWLSKLHSNCRQEFISEISIFLRSLNFISFFAVFQRIFLDLRWKNDARGLLTLHSIFGQTQFEENFYLSEIKIWFFLQTFVKCFAMGCQKLLLRVQRNIMRNFVGFFHILSSDFERKTLQLLSIKL